jgi:hypothetical protein
MAGNDFEKYGRGFEADEGTLRFPLKSFKKSFVDFLAGRNPACSWPRTGFRSAHRISPLSIPAIGSHPQLTLLLP